MFAFSSYVSGISAARALCGISKRVTLNRVRIVNSNNQKNRRFSDQLLSGIKSIKYVIEIGSNDRPMNICLLPNLDLILSDKAPIKGSLIASKNNASKRAEPVRIGFNPRTVR